MTVEEVIALVDQLDVKDQMKVVDHLSVCPYDCDGCHDDTCPCERLGCAGNPL